MNRYKATMINKSSIRSKQTSKNKQMKYKTTLYDKVPERDDDIYIITQTGDRLDNLATVFYGDASYWWYIPHTNGITTLNMPAGVSLRIPLTVEYAKGK